jgi:hypothetical protein
MKNIHSVGTFRGTSSKKPVRGARRMEKNVSRIINPFGMYHEPVF